MQVVDITEDANHSDVEQFRGFSVRESATIGADATVRFRKESVSGQVIVYLELEANQSATITFKEAITAEGGTYVEVVSGEVEGILYF